MSFVYWTSDLDTGFEDIDEQHRQLVDYTNKLYDAKEANDKEGIERGLENPLLQRQRGLRPPLRPGAHGGAPSQRTSAFSRKKRFLPSVGRWLAA